MVLKHNKQATAIGCIAIILWGFLAYFTKLTEARIPPFQMVTITFSIGALLMVGRWISRGVNGFEYFRQPALAWIIGIAALFGYHFFYFLAMTLAPAVQVSLIAYLWPLFIVLFSSFLPGEHLSIKHVIGAILAFMGCWILVAQNGTGFQPQYIKGYLIAFSCALIWSGYSVLNRLVANVPTDAVAWFMMVAAFLSLGCHLMFENTFWPTNINQWMGLLGLGLGPLGMAFFTWDYGTKHGDIKLLGVLAYLSPLISVLVLVAAGMASSSPSLWVACLAIVIGSVIAGVSFKDIKPKS